MALPEAELSQNREEQPLKSISRMITKCSRQGLLNESHGDQKKIPSLSPSDRSEDNKSNYKSFNSGIMNKVVAQKKKRRRKPQIESGSSFKHSVSGYEENRLRSENRRPLFDNTSNEVSHLESINETINSKHEQKSSYYEEEKSQRTGRGNYKKKRNSLKTRENTERRNIHKFKQKQPKQSLKQKNSSSNNISMDVPMSIIGVGGIDGKTR